MTKKTGSSFRTFNSFEEQIQACLICRSNLQNVKSNVLKYWEEVVVSAFCSLLNPLKMRSWFHGPNAGITAAETRDDPVQIDKLVGEAVHGIVAEYHPLFSTPIAFLATARRMPSSRHTHHRLITSPWRTFERLHHPSIAIKRARWTSSVTFFISELSLDVMTAELGTGSHHGYA